jgi:hypothetical protein
VFTLPTELSWLSDPKEGLEKPVFTCHMEYEGSWFNDGKIKFVFADFHDFSDNFFPSVTRRAVAVVRRNLYHAYSLPL